MTRRNRQQAKALGLSKCYGSLCEKHPDLDGYRWVSGSCVECAKEHTRNSRKASPERVREHAKKSWERIKTNPELLAKKLASDAAYRKRNKAKVRAGEYAWREKNPERVAIHKQTAKGKYKVQKNANTALRRASIRMRTPKWLSADDFWVFEQAYELAQIRAKLFGFGWHVDHIVPLQGKMVSGLHVPWNIQVIPGALNIKKGNRLIEVAF